MFKCFLSGEAGISLVCFISFLLLSCGGQPVKQQTAEYQLIWTHADDPSILDRTLVPHMSGAEILALGADGLQLIINSQQPVAQLRGNYEQVETAALNASSSLLAALNASNNQIELGVVKDDAVFKTGSVPKVKHEIAGFCLGRSNPGWIHLFLVGETGAGSQWLVAQNNQLLKNPRLVRELPIPPMAQYCQVRHDELIVNEESVGFWRYLAGPEAETERKPLAMVTPYGELSAGAGDIGIVPGGLVLLDPGAGELLLISSSDPVDINKLKLPKDIQDPEQLQVAQTEHELQIRVRDDESGFWWQTLVSWSNQDQTLVSYISEVSPAVETDPVENYGDAADDPAIWVNTQDASRSLVLGTNKKTGLLVYGLDGKLKQSLPVGRLNNVDVRSVIIAGDTTLSLAAASHRDTNSISLFTINPNSLLVEHVADIATPLTEVYGLCLYQPAKDRLYAFINDKNGEVLQYQIDTLNFTGQMVRRLHLASQPEGCVADDQRQLLFVGEEDFGVWQFEAEPDGAVNPTQVITVGKQLVADVEGLALYHRGSGFAPWLVVSSQGNNSYVLVESAAPYRVAGIFQIVASAKLGIDGASETDGLDVVAANLGGEFSEGLLVVQDGRNRMPDDTQNFKYVPWSVIARELGLH